MTDRPNLTRDGRPRRDAALFADLAAGRSTSDLAAATGLSERTIPRRRRDPEVVAVRAIFADQIIDRLAHSSTRAVAALDRLLDCQNPSVAVAAARTILQGLIAMREHDELVIRIEALEESRGIGPR